MKTMTVLHEEALRLTTTFRNAERELIGVLQAIDLCRGYRELDYTSLFKYAVGGLGLSESVAFNLISIARKAREIPALKAKVESGEISITNARMIAPILTLANQEQILAHAATLPKRELERQITRQFPGRAVRESSRFVAPERIELKMGISPELEKKLKRAQDLVSQSKGRHANLEETLSAVLEIYLRHKDPVEKAERVARRSGSDLAVISQQGASMKTGRAKVQPTSLGQTKSKQQLETEHPLSGMFATFSPVPVQGFRAGGRSVGRPKWFANSSRRPYPAAIRHAIMRRDQGQCTAKDKQGHRCQEKRWLDFHHVIPRSRGGLDSAENLTLLCRSHHLGHHRKTSLS